MQTCGNLEGYSVHGVAVGVIFDDPCQTTTNQYVWKKLASSTTFPL